MALWKHYRKEVSHSRAAVSSLQSQGRGDLGDRSRGSAQDELRLPVAPLVASLKGALRVQEGKVKMHT